MGWLDMVYLRALDRISWSGWSSLNKNTLQPSLSLPGFGTPWSALSTWGGSHPFRERGGALSSFLPSLLSSMTVLEHIAEWSYSLIPVLVWMYGFAFFFFLFSRFLSLRHLSSREAHSCHSCNIYTYSHPTLFFWPSAASFSWRLHPCSDPELQSFSWHWRPSPVVG